MTPTATLDRLAEMRGRAAAADAAAAELQAELDAEVASRLADRDARVQKWALATIDQHRERYAALQTAWQEARALFLAGVVEDITQAPALWANWATLTGKVHAEFEAFMTATASLDPRRWDREPAPQPPARIVMPALAEALDQAFAALAASRAADQHDARQAELSEELRIEGMG